MTRFHVWIIPRFTAVAMAAGMTAFAGCGDGVKLRPERSDFTVQVMSGGKPVSGINLGLSPVDEGLPAGVALKAGNGQGRAIPGRYMYFVALGDAKGAQATKAASAVLQLIPRKYHEGDPDRLVDITSGGTIELQLD